MKTNGNGLLLLALAVLIIGSGAVVTTKLIARGLRNNNPGNIKEMPGDKTQWQGERATDDDPIFEEFDGMWQGVRALAVTLLTYSRRYGLNTVRGIITRWAPGSENNTAAYIASVCAALGVTPDQRIDVRERLYALTKAICVHENGALAVAMYLPESELRKGVNNALA